MRGRAAQVGAAVAVSLVWSGASPGAGRPSAAAARPPQAAAADSAAASVLDGVFTADQAAHGDATFRRVCAACHDPGEFAGGRFRLAWVGRTAGDLFDTIATLMPEGDPGSLRPAEYAAVVAYLLQMNGYPAGAAPLPAALPALQALEIVAAP